MSKYIKLEDAINKLDEWFCEPYTPTELLSDLPTIEVSEDCISKAYLEQEIENQIMPAIDREMYWQGWNNALCKVVELIEDAPSVVPKPKEGEWVKVDDSVQPICSKCGMSCSGIHRNADYSVVPTWKYCPNCGAKMKGIEE